jgi:hypothetical protein
VHAHHDTGLLDQLPERVELGQRERARALPTRYRSRANEDDPRAVVDQPFELLDRTVEDGQRDHRRGEDAVLVVEGPLVEHPSVERVDHGVDRLGVVTQHLDQARKRRPHDRPVDALLVHHLEPRLGRPEGGKAVHAAAQISATLALGVADLEVLLLRSGHGDPIEGGVRDVLGDATAHRDLGSPVDLDVLDEPLVLRRQVAGERLLGFVQVVVGIEDFEVELT